MLRNVKYLSIVSFLASLLAMSPSYALEWDDAYFSGSFGAYYVIQQEGEPYPSSPAVNLAAAYHLPFFVEGHVKAVAQGQYGWFAATPKVREGKRGAATHRLAFNALLMRNAELGQQSVWWGGGLGVQGRFLYYHYEWQREAGEWDLEIFKDDWIVSPSLIAALHFPLSGPLSIETRLEWSAFDDSPHVLGIDLGYRF